MRLREVRGSAPPDVEALREYPDAEVRLLYASGYWDGPLEGLAEVAGERLWYCFAEESEGEQAWYRRFWLIRLSPQQLEEEDERQGSFRAHVGTHFDYDANRARHVEGLKPRDGWHEHYDRYPPEQAQPSDPDTCLVVGWFES